MMARPTPEDAPPFPFIHGQVVNLRAYAPEASPLPDFVVIGNYANDRARWEAHPLRSRYAVACDLGYRRSYDWGLRWRTKSESRVAGWIYRRK